MRLMHLLPALLVFAGVACARSERVQAEFVAGPKIDAWTGEMQRGGDWACTGELVAASVDRMPEPDYMYGDDMHELDADGKVLRTWHVPLEAVPLGIDGDRLIVELTRQDDQPAIAVGLDGVIRRVERPPALPSSAHAHCPANSRLPQSDYQWCVTLPDMGAPATTHLVAYNGPCT